ncbi:MAG: fibronectin type III domain-containing protein [Microscillaceae bacterium]|nr:fibronectin type III domain-containing protein [Microscillaceae bacterium]
MKNYITFLFLLILLDCSRTAWAQRAGSLNAFLNMDGPDQRVNDIQILADGKILIVGFFNAYNSSGIRQGHIARLIKDGSLDTGFDTGIGANNVIQAVRVQSDGKILLGGDFLEFNLQNYGRIVRLEPGGSTDTSFHIGAGANNSITAIEIQPDRKILLGGSFSTFNQKNSRGIVRLNHNGSVDTTFQVGTGANNVIRSILLQEDGKIIIAGDFTQYNGMSANRIARLNADGTLDQNFQIGSGASDGVYTMALQGNKILIGGKFSFFNGIRVNNLARLNANGTLDATFLTENGASGLVNTLSVQQTDHKIILGGNFSFFNGTRVNNLARLNADGTLDASLVHPLAGNHHVYSSEIQTDGRILLAGNFDKLKGPNKDYLIRLNSNGSIHSNFNSNSGGNGLVSTIKMQADEKLLIGGAFTSFNNTTANRIVRLHPNGSIDESFNSGIGANDTVRNICIQKDGKIILVGNFTSYNGLNANRIARLNPDGSLDETFAIGVGADNIIFSVDIQEDQKILVGGRFTTFNNQTINRLVRLHKDGSIDESFQVGTGVNGDVLTMSILKDSTILIGGRFSQYNETFRYRIAKLNSDGSLNQEFKPGGGFDRPVKKIIPQTDHKIIVCGDFSSFSGTPRENIARLNPDGSLDKAFNPGDDFNNDDIEYAVIQPDKKILIGGKFTNFNNTGRAFLVRLGADGRLDSSFDPIIGPDAPVFTLMLREDGKAVVGGLFKEYDGAKRGGIARIFCSVPAIPAEFYSSDIQKTSFRLSWNKVSGIDEYEVDISDDNFVSILPEYLNLFVTDTTLLIENIEPGTQYSCVVRAINEQGTSPNSRPLQVVIQPETPESFEASPISLSQIQLNWTFDPLDGNTYKIQFSQESDSVFTDLTLLNGNSYTHSGLNPASTYYYRIQAFKNGVFSDFSEVVGATTFADIVTADMLPHNQNLRTYPNPTDDVLILEWDTAIKDIQKLSLSDCHGRTLLEKELSAGENTQTLSLDSLPKGVYYLKLIGNDRIWIRKIIH